MQIIGTIYNINKTTLIDIVIAPGFNCTCINYNWRIISAWGGRCTRRLVCRIFPLLNDIHPFN